MKKIIALALAVLMMAVAMIPALAAREVPAVSETGDSLNTDLELTYGVKQSFMVYIPSAVDFGSELSVTAKVEVKDVYIAGNEQLNIAIRSANKTGEGETEQWWLVDENEASVSVKYTASIPPSQRLFNGSRILSVAAPTGDSGAASDAKGSVIVTFATKGTAQVGNYRDTLTFSITIDKVPATPAP